MLAGDAAYPNIPWIIKPYPGKNLTPEEESFNTYLSSSRIVVENAFGRLKARWRMFNQKLPMDIKRAPAIISACCILHNICENEQMPAEDAILDTTTNWFDEHQLPDLQRNAVRDAIREHLACNYPLSQSIIS